MFRNSLRPSANSRPSNNARSRGRVGDKLLAGPDLSNQTFYFAKLPLNEIQEDIAVFLEREVSIDELKNPTPDLVKELVGFFINEVFDKRVEDMSQSEFGCIDQLDYPELYDDNAIAHVTFLRYARKLFDACMFDGFGLRDIHSPERSRFQWQMSALVNLTRFRQKRLAVFEEMVASTDERLEVELGLRETHAKLQRDIDEIKNVRTKEEPEVKELEAKAVELKEVLAEQHQKQIDYTEKTHERKAALAKLTEDQEELDKTLDMERDTVQRMQTKVVSSPGRVKAEFQNLENTLESEKAYIASMRHRTREINARNDALKKVLTQAETLCHSSTDVLEKLKVRKRLIADIESTKAQKAELESEFKACSDSKAYYENNMSSLAVRIARCKEQKENIMNGNTAADRERAEQVRLREAALEQKQRQRDDKIANARVLEQEIFDMTKAIRDETEHVREKQQQVFERMCAFDKDLRAVQEIYSAANEKAADDFQELLSTGKAPSGGHDNYKE